jgi:hypothetical protein
MLDVHPPHETPHGPRDFFLHLFTITIGLLIALSLEGLVEWQHHRHLAHDAESSMQREIKSNAAGMADTLTELHAEQAGLKHDVELLSLVEKAGKYPENSNMSVSFHIHTFDDLSWRTAETTGALAYIPYDEAEKYADIYKRQEELAASEHDAARDAAVALAPFLNSGSDGPSAAEAQSMIEKLGVLQGQLMIVDSFMTSLDRHYKKFLGTA